MTFCNWIPVIGYLCHSHVNYVGFNGILLTMLCELPTGTVFKKTLWSIENTRQWLFCSEKVLKTD